MSKTWWGHYIIVDKGEEYIRFKDYLELSNRIDKAIEITHKLLMNSADNRMIAKEEEMDYFDWLDRTLEEQLEILRGGEDNR